MQGVQSEADTHAVASVLKQFFRELPDRLVPTSHHTAFDTAIKNTVSQFHLLMSVAHQTQEEQQRRILLHQAVNDLPDANYSTLRYLILHVRRISTRVSAANALA